VHLPEPDHSPSNASQHSNDHGLLMAIERLERLDQDALLTLGRLRMRYPSGSHRRRIDQILLRHDLPADGPGSLNERCRAIWQDPAFRYTNGVIEVTAGSGADTAG
jgi:hypothetical protein